MRRAGVNTTALFRASTWCEARGRSRPVKQSRVVVVGSVLMQSPQRDWSNVFMSGGFPSWTPPGRLDNGTCACCGGVPYPSGAKNGTQGYVEVGWLCAHCGNDNYHNLPSCKRCFSARPSEQKKDCVLKLPKKVTDTEKTKMTTRPSYAVMARSEPPPQEIAPGFRLVALRDRVEQDVLAEELRRVEEKFDGVTEKLQALQVSHEEKVQTMDALQAELERANLNNDILLQSALKTKKESAAK